MISYNSVEVVCGQTIHHLFCLGPKQLLWESFDRASPEKTPQIWFWRMLLPVSILEILRAAQLSDSSVDNVIVGRHLIHVLKSSVIHKEDSVYLSV